MRLAIEEAGEKHKNSLLTLHSARLKLTEFFCLCLFFSFFNYLNYHRFLSEQHSESGDCGSLQ